MKNTVLGETIQHKYPSTCMADIIMRPFMVDGILDLAGDGDILIIGVVIIHIMDTDGAIPIFGVVIIHITDMGAITVMLTIEDEVIIAIRWLELITEDEVITITAVEELIITIEEGITVIKTVIIQDLNLVEDQSQILET
jgi:hypothetical protein